MSQKRKSKYKQRKKSTISKHFVNDFNIEIPKPRIESPKFPSFISCIAKHDLSDSEKRPMKSSGTFNFDINKNLKKEKKPRLIIKYNIDDFEELI